ELVFLNCYIELVAGKTGDRQRDTQPLGLAIGALALLNIVRRVTVGAFDDAVEHALDVVKSQQERTGERRNTRHSLQSPRVKRLWSRDQQKWKPVLRPVARRS